MPGQATPQTDFSLLPTQHTMPCRAHPISDSPTRVPRWDYPLTQPTVLQPTPWGCSAPVPAAWHQPSPGNSIHDACPPPLPCPQLCASVSPPGYRRRQASGSVWEGSWEWGRELRTPHPLPLHKTCGTAGMKGSPHPAAWGWCCQGAKAGGLRACQDWTNRAGKSTGPGDSSLAGEGGWAAECGTPWHAAQSCLCVSPSPPHPAGKQHRVAFWGRLAAGVGSPTTPCRPGGLRPQYADPLSVFRGPHPDSG